MVGGMMTCPIKIDLALEKRRRDESVTKYITRWRNLSMRCDQQLTEKHAVELLMGSIDDRSEELQNSEED